MMRNMDRGHAGGAGGAGGSAQYMPSSMGGGMDSAPLDSRQSMGMAAPASRDTNTTQDGRMSGVSRGDNQSALSRGRAPSSKPTTAGDDGGVAPAI